MPSSTFFNGQNKPKVPSDKSKKKNFDWDFEEKSEEPSNIVLLSLLKNSGISLPGDREKPVEGAAVTSVLSPRKP